MQVWQGLTVRDLRAQLAQANTSAPPDGLPVGTPAPQFTLPTPDGTTRTLAHWQEHGRPLALVFLHPGCGPCRKLATDLPDTLGQRTDALQVLVIGSGKPADNALWATDYALTDVLVQDHNEVAAQYKIRGTPSTVLLDPSGRIAAPTASGPTASRELLATTIRYPQPKGTA
ncbi:peroxiredoxin family protein [Streptomyces griseus]|uniref:peroxiredoxin family protein n=1 Tax=Streptomyces griseus TaxID=1911 RepID=UPI0037B11B15